MSYSNLPTREQLKEITRKAIIHQQDDAIQTTERRYKVFRQSVIDTIYQLPAIANQTGETSHTSRSYTSSHYCNELQQYIKISTK